MKHTAALLIVIESKLRARGGNTWKCVGLPKF